MTKIIDETFNLPSMDDVEDDQTENLPEVRKQTAPTVNKNDRHDQETDEIREKAMTAFDDIMEVGRNVNPERSARLFEVAGQFLKTGLDASNSKMDKELKAAKLKLEAKRLKVDDETLDTINHGAEILADRNALLRTLIHESEENTVDIEADEENTEDSDENNSN